jgi:NADPH-dependent 2,4-dienoyl-CoA reductase/sulfur reductase-like enzyme/nitrite reductase/ring-hydroxylating ferredoxin subunit
MADMQDEAGTDFRSGIALRDLREGRMLRGRIDGEDAVVLRSGNEVFAVGAHCSHYHGPLAEGHVVGDTLRCPWHHACFSLRSGAALRAPALDAIACWRVEQIGESAFVRERIASPESTRGAARVPLAARPRSVAIVGGGAAGLACADRLRREGYDGSLTLLSADAAPPCDRPNLSKDYLAGTAPEDWIPLRPAAWYADQGIDLKLASRVDSIDLAQKRLRLAGGEELSADAVLLATGADPVRLDIPGAAPAMVHYLRSFADSRAIVAAAGGAKQAVVIGASFIGLEVAAALRQRGIEVHVVGPEPVPLERVLGRVLGEFVRRLHESHGVIFHLGCTVTRVEDKVTVLSDGARVGADFLVAGVGVRPSLQLAESAGLAIDRGVAVNSFLETSAPGVFAAGDVARWPDPRTGQRIRVEHWVVAQRQGQVAALNILGTRTPFTAVPFFWSQHYDVAINYVGHAEGIDAVDVEGSPDARDCAASFRRGDRVLALATIGRDRQSLEAEVAMELQV